MKPTPLLTQYIQSVENAEDCFKTLLPIAPIIENGKPKFASGGFAIVFKMQGGDKKNLAVKCFTSEQAERGRRFQKIQHFLKQNPMPFWIDFQYIESELWVNTTPQDGDEYDIVAMPWVEGRTLGEAVREACHRGDKSALRQLLTKFIDMALLLLALPCAHGDLKHDNIMVGNDGKLYLVDYDGFFVPDFKGEKSQERGSDDYQHPSRNTTTFDRHIDDFSIAIIALSLVALCERPDLYAQYNQGQNFIFSRADFAQNTLSQATIWAGLNLPKPITELLKYTEQQNSYKLPMLSGYLSELREEMGNSLQDWWDSLSDVEREILTINYALSKNKWIELEDDRHTESIFELKRQTTILPVVLDELVQLHKLIIRGGYHYNAVDYDKYEHETTDNEKITSLSFILPFTNLINLDCSNTNISSLDFLKNHKKIQNLYCSNTKMNSLSGIENCPNLNRLNCSNNNITSLDELSNSVNLIFIDISNNQIISLEPLQKCFSLSYLYCSNNQIKSLKGIGNSVYISRLDCSNNEICSFEEVILNDKLTFLNCSNNQLKSLKGLENVYNLANLNCSNNKIYSLKEIGYCDELAVLDCSNNQIQSLKDIKNLYYIENFNCSNNQISSFEGSFQGDENFSSYTPKRNMVVHDFLALGMKLKYLNCSNNKITSLKYFQIAFSLIKLDCFNNQITSLNGLENAVRLYNLDCSNNQIISLNELKNAVNLYDLDCSSTQITSLSGIEYCVNLRKLNCSYTEITSLSGLEKCLNLQELYCRDTRITSLVNIKNSINLQVLDCSKTQITSLASIKNSINLKLLYFSKTEIITLVSLINCINLQQLYCPSTKIKSLSGIENCVNLQSIICRNTGIAQQEKSRIQKILHSCKISY